jgi:hypothetical protein
LLAENETYAETEIGIEMIETTQMTEIELKMTVNDSTALKTLILILTSGMYFMRFWF